MCRLDCELEITRIGLADLGDRLTIVGALDQLEARGVCVIHPRFESDIAATFQ